MAELLLATAGRKCFEAGVGEERDNRCSDDNAQQPKDGVAGRLPAVLALGTVSSGGFGIVDANAVLARRAEAAKDAGQSTVAIGIGFVGMR